MEKRPWSFKFKNETPILDIIFKISMIGGSAILYLLLFIMIGQIQQVATELKEIPARMSATQVLPAGVYICDGQRCVIANSENITR